MISVCTTAIGSRHNKNVWRICDDILKKVIRFVWKQPAGGAGVFELIDDLRGISSGEKPKMVLRIERGQKHSNKG